MDLIGRAEIDLDRAASDVLFNALIDVCLEVGLRPSVGRARPTPSQGAHDAPAVVFASAGRIGRYKTDRYRGAFIVSLTLGAATRTSSTSVRWNDTREIVECTLSRSTPERLVRTLLLDILWNFGDLYSTRRDLGVLASLLREADDSVRATVVRMVLADDGYRLVLRGPVGHFDFVCVRDDPNEAVPTLVMCSTARRSRSADGDQLASALRATLLREEIESLGIGHIEVILANGGIDYSSGRRSTRTRSRLFLELSAFSVRLHEWSDSLLARRVFDCPNALLFLVGQSRQREVSLSRTEPKEVDHSAVYWRDISRFVAHEVGNPVSGISADLATLEQLIRDSPTIAADDSNRLPEVMERLQRRTRQADRILAQLKRFQQSGEFPKEFVDAASLVADGLRPYADHLDVKFTVDVESCPLFCNRLLMVQVFTELTENSTRHFDKDTKEIRVTGRRLDHFYEFVFSDNGRGVANDLKLKIFEPAFLRGTNGSGLGLAIVYGTIAEIHRGSVQELGLEGVGAEFKIQMRLSPNASETRDRPTEDQDD